MNKWYITYNKEKIIFFEFIFNTSNSFNLVITNNVK